jgi:hypothetical protein
MMTTEEFWSQLGYFNATTWPVQIIWLVAVMIALYLIFTQRTAWANIAMKLLLSFAFAWNGVGFFLVVADGPIYDYFYAPLFILIAILLIVDIFTKRTVFKLPEKRWIKYATYTWILSWLIYPLVGMALGRDFPRVCTPMNPCPSTVFAIALVAAAIPKTDKILFIMLLPWAIMGLPKCLGIFNCYEDCILFASGVYGLGMLIANWRAISQKLPA